MPDQLREACAVCYPDKHVHEWTVWRGGFTSTHRHIVNTQARWLRDEALGRASEDRQRRVVGQGPLWTGEEGALGSEARCQPRSMVLFNAYPKHWGSPTDEKTDKCICGMSAREESGTGECTGTADAAVRTSRGCRDATKSASAARRGVLATGRATLSEIVRPPRNCRRGPSSNHRIDQLRESHMDMLAAAHKAAENSDSSVRQAARIALENKVLQIDATIAALAAMRGRARVEAMARVRFSKDGECK